MTEARLDIDVVTLFPEMFRGALDASIPARALARGAASVRLHALREFGLGAHRQVDDAPFGGGAGMVLRPEPLFQAVEAITGRPAGSCPGDEAIVLLAPAGEPFTQAHARRYARLRRLVLVCGRYEGVDDRVRTHLCTETVSIGDFVLSGGEPAAVVVMDAVLRLLPGVLGNDASASTESFENGRLEAPHFTRPAEFRGVRVPPELVSGNHAAIAAWRERESLRLTQRVRPDLRAGDAFRSEPHAVPARSGENDPPAQAGENQPARAGENDPPAQSGERNPPVATGAIMPAHAGDARLMS